MGFFTEMFKLQGQTSCLPVRAASCRLKHEARTPREPAGFQPAPGVWTFWTWIRRRPEDARQPPGCPCASLGERFDNSPAVHCRDSMAQRISPEGTVDSGTPSGLVLIGSREEHDIEPPKQNCAGVVRTQPSRRDSAFSIAVPALKGWAIFKSPSGRWRTARRPNF